MSTGARTVLLIDDDPSHLKLYSLIVGRAGFRALTALVSGPSLELPSEETVDLCLLDYRIGTALSSVDVARRLQQIFPAKPIVILSDMPWMPDDVAPYATAFVRKGEPEKIVEMIGRLVEAGSDSR